MGKVCTGCKKEKKENEFYKAGKRYLHSLCILCYQDKKKRFDVKCFRCGVDFRCAKKFGYCSRKCKYEGLSLRMEHEYTLGIRTNYINNGEE